MGGVIGFDINALMALGRGVGLSERAMAILLPAAEAGMVKGFAKLTKSEGG